MSTSGLSQCIASLVSISSSFKSGVSDFGQPEVMNLFSVLCIGLVWCSDLKQMHCLLQCVICGAMMSYTALQYQIQL